MNDTTQAACAQVRELEAELENEQRKSRDALGSAKRFERQWKEVRHSSVLCNLLLHFDAYVLNSRRTRWHLQLLMQIEEEKRLNAELQDLLDKTQLKLKQYKRQVDEAVRASLGDSLSLQPALSELCTRRRKWSRSRLTSTGGRRRRLRRRRHTPVQILEFIFI